jgi:hypothetical protein
MKNHPEIRAIPRDRKPLSLFLFFAVVLAANSQSVRYKNVTIAAEAMTNRTLSTLMSDESFRSSTTQRGLDPGLLAFANFNNAIGMAGSFFDEPLRLLHPDEVICGEMWFGRALACRASNPEVVVATVVTQPMPVIYQYWLERTASDFRIFKLVSMQRGGKDVMSFVKEGEQVYNDEGDEGSIPSKLRTGYCNAVPAGTYSGTDGQKRSCGSAVK